MGDRSFEIPTLRHICTDVFSLVVGGGVKLSQGIKCKCEPGKSLTSNFI